MKIAWFHVNGAVCRMDPPIEFDKVKELEARFPGSVVEPLDHFEYEAKMILNMPLADRKPYIESTPADQQELLRAEVTRQWKLR